jgi:hypothetical protein
MATSRSDGHMKIISQKFEIGDIDSEKLGNHLGKYTKISLTSSILKIDALGLVIENNF